MKTPWVKATMKNTKPYYIKINSPTLKQAKPWVAKCLKEHGIPPTNIKKYKTVKRPGRTPKNRIFYYERPVGLIICGSCGKVVPEDNNICLSCGVIFNKRLIELTNNV